MSNVDVNEVLSKGEQVEAITEWWNGEFTFDEFASKRGWTVEFTIEVLKSAHGILTERGIVL